MTCELVGDKRNLIPSQKVNKNARAAPASKSRPSWLVRSVALNRFFCFELGVSGGISAFSGIASISKGRLDDNLTF